jgi:hypothetical protein
VGIEWGSLSTGEQIVSVAAAIAAVASAFAGWYGAILSHRTNKRLAREHTVLLRASADHAKHVRHNQTRVLREERVRVRVLNLGRPIQVESMVFRPKGADRIPEGLFEIWAAHSFEKPLQLPTHETHVLQLAVDALLKVDLRAQYRKPVRIRLVDGQSVDVRVRGLRRILNELADFKRDLDAGYELILPQRFVWIGNSGKSIEAFNGIIPANGEIRGETKGEDVPLEEQLAWRAGRNPQVEAVMAARAKKPRKRLLRRSV